jgi:site-specific DNA recombinase
MDAVIYCRISQDRSGEALGVARQEKECRELAERLGWAVSNVLTDNDVSASTGRRRPSYEALLQGVEDGRWKAVLAFNNDRLHRSPRELERFIDVIEKAGASVSTVHGGSVDLSTPGGRMVARMLGAAARHEVEVKAARQRSKHRELAESGRPSGGGRPAYGFMEDRITHRPEEADLLRAAAEDVLQGGSLHRWAKATGLSRRGLQRLLTSPRIAGLREHHGRLTEAVWAPIISPDDRLRLVALFEGRPSPPPPGRHLLSGLVVCGREGCGAVLTSTSQRRAGTEHVRRWACKACLRNGLLAAPLEELVDAAVGRVLAEIGPVSRTGPALPDATALAALEARRAELLEMLGAGELSRAEYTSAVAALERRAAELPAIPAAAVTWDAVAEWEAVADGAERNAVLRKLGLRLVVAPAARGANRFDAGRIARFEILGRDMTARTDLWL